jgi:natural product precursor
MKQKNLKEKLVLKKTTIAQLEQKELNGVKGGTWLTNFRCPYTMTLCGLYHCP